MSKRLCLLPIGCALAVALGIFSLTAPAIKAIGEVSGMKSKNNRQNSQIRKVAPPGKLVDVGGYQLYIHCTGEGEPDCGVGFRTRRPAQMTGRMYNPNLQNLPGSVHTIAPVTASAIPVPHPAPGSRLSMNSINYWSMQELKAPMFWWGTRLVDCMFAFTLVSIRTKWSGWR